MTTIEGPNEECDRRKVGYLHNQANEPRFTPVANLEVRLTGLLCEEEDERGSPQQPPPPPPPPPPQISPPPPLKPPLVAAQLLFCAACLLV